MSNKGKKKPLLVAMTAIMMSASGLCSAAAAPTETLVGMPNPIVEYQTDEDMINTIGFTPLYLPKISGYSCDSISVISKKIADVRFQRLGDRNSKLRIRTAQQDDFSGDDISGIYSVTWEEKHINDTAISIAKMKDHSYAAHWKTGKYLFSVQADGISYLEFMSLLSDCLVDLTAHYYQ
ncbi:MAG: hypothetical protein E6713_10900 [Sporomusaceae bacterium]|nr:hypothetical protein [Sporomusaceae bacterium]